MSGGGVLVGATAGTALGSFPAEKNGLMRITTGGFSSGARVGAVAMIALASPGWTADAQVSRYAGLATRVEVHMLPAVSTGPLDPAWSPDGRWIAFSMRGDIWKIPVRGGEAIAITQGPGYHFEPAWHPDGGSLAITVDIDGNLDIAVVDAKGGNVRHVTHHPGIDVQPTWEPDGRHIVFASNRTGDLDILRVDPESGETSPVVDGPGNQIQPAVSPDGERLAFVAPVRGRLGSGGIWVTPLSHPEPTLVHYDETSYRARPRWTPDGAAFVYSSDAAGSNDIAIVPSGGGNRVRLTADPMDEFAPAVSPDGSTVAFVSNRGGPTRLSTITIGGGPTAAWNTVPIEARVTPVATGRLRGEVVGPDGTQIPARIQLLASDGRGYAPDAGFHRVSSANEIHYFHSTGSFEVVVPAGRVTIEAVKGFEYVPSRAEVEVPANRTATLRLPLRRLIDPTSRGWYAGDTHVHDLHEGRYGLTQEEFYHQLVADDVHVANALVHMDGTKLMGRWSDLTGRVYPSSDPAHILRYSEEFRGSFGHVGLLGLKRFIMPLIGGARGTPYAADVLKLRYLDEVRRQGGIGGFVHPYNGSVNDPASAAQSDIPVHVALGRGDFFDVVSIASDELASASMYYRMLGSGFRLAATGGTDNFSDVWRDPSGGTARTYARVDGPLTFTSWIEAVRTGRTFATNGPLLFVEVDGREPGAEIRLGPAAPTSFTVHAEMISLAPVAKLEILVNGQVAHTASPGGDGTRMEVTAPVELAGSGWIAARVIGGKHRYVGDNYAFAQTTPVYVVREGAHLGSRADARFLLDTVEALWQRVDARGMWTSAAGRKRYLDAIEEAKGVLRNLMRRSDIDPRREVTSHGEVRQRQEKR